MGIWHRLRLRQRFMVIVGGGIIALAVAVVAVIAHYEESAMEKKLHQLSVNEMTSLHALIVNVMAKRPDDADNIGITVFNNWFDSRNAHYPGKVWSVWGPKVTSFMADTNPEHPAKPAMDDVDREALARGQPVARQVGDNYRYALPIVLGVTDGAKAEVCHTCHGAGMGMKDGDVIAVLSSSLSMAAERHELRSFLLILLGCGFIATLSAMAAVRWILGRVITRPIGQMTRLMDRLAEGDTGVTVAGLERRDEVGDIARAVEVFREHMRDGERLRQDQEVERGRAAAEKTAAFHAMAEHFEDTVKAKVSEVDAATTGIRATAQAMASRSESSGGRSLDVGEAAKVTTERAASASQATQQLAESINVIAGHVGHSTGIAQKAVADIAAATERMNELLRSAQSIDEIVALINNIAAQTNLLALNATIEAARAGAAGKGFAVVASEVKNLAGQTAQATQDIASQVAAVQTSSHDMMQAITGVAETIRAMDQISATVAAAVQQQKTATAEIASDINEVAHQAGAVSQSVSHLSRASAMACAGTVRVIWSAKGLAKVVEDLNHETNRFLVMVRQ